MKIVHLWQLRNRNEEYVEEDDDHSRGALLERNSEGVLYFRQPRGNDQFTTWHI